eukprot:3432641-Prymnesium_polylepis.1
MDLHDLSEVSKSKKECDPIRLPGTVADDIKTRGNPGDRPLDRTIACGTYVIPPAGGPEVLR